MSYIHHIMRTLHQQAARMARLALIADELGQNEYREQVATASLLTAAKQIST
jgi:hypothetical protein